MDARRLHAAVDEAFATTGAATPPWPDPRPGGESPSDEEYSRCADPGKYRILKARAEAWRQALTRAGLAVAEESSDSAGVWRDQRPSGAEPGGTLRLRPLRAQAAPLLLEFGAVGGIPDAAVNVGAGEPAVLLESLPDCGCDACDDGSASLLEVFDSSVLAVVSGEFVHIGRGEDTIVSVGDGGWAAGGRFARSRRDPESLLREARAGRSPYPTVHGERWW